MHDNCKIIKLGRWRDQEIATVFHLEAKRGGTVQIKARKSGLQFKLEGSPKKFNTCRTVTKQKLTGEKPNTTPNVVD